MDYQKLHLEERIVEAQAAIAKFTASAAQDDAFVAEFQETDPATAEIYRGWKKFHLEKIAYFQNVMQDLNSRLERRNA